MKHSKQWYVMIVFVLSALMILPFLGLTDFNTKGEPREAVVALSMLKNGNWILPINNGGDIPYKPPFLHWCIALFSMPFGHVSEFTSRMPSALSLIFMVTVCFGFYLKRKNLVVAFVAALLTLTCFEVHRAGVSCRVDMMLTSFIVISIVSLYLWWEKGHHSLPIISIICMSIATLTKGPVGVILPRAVMGVFMLLRGAKFWNTFLRFVLIGVLSCILPLVWYFAAYMQGGEKFIQLVWEENIGRMTGTMTYGSHLHPFYYIEIMFLSGWLPWTLLLLFSLFVLPWKNVFKISIKGNTCGDLWNKFILLCKKVEPIQLYTWLSFILIAVFYSIPSSKRPTYILPCYPFMAVLIAEFIVWLIHNHRRPLAVYLGTVSAIGLLILVAHVYLVQVGLPDTMFHGRHAYQNIMQMHAIENISINGFNLIFLALLLSSSIYGIICLIRKESSYNIVTCMFAVVASINLALDSTYLPAILNANSSKPLAALIKHKYPHERVYSYFTDDSADRMHFFGADFYLNDEIGDINQQHPLSGVLMVGEGCQSTLKSAYKYYTFTQEYVTRNPYPDTKEKIYFYRFKRNCAVCSIAKE